MGVTNPSPPNCLRPCKILSLTLHDLLCPLLVLPFRLVGAGSEFLPALQASSYPDTGYTKPEVFFDSLQQPGTSARLSVHKYLHSMPSLLTSRISATPRVSDTLDCKASRHPALDYLAPALAPSCLPFSFLVQLGSAEAN